MKKILSMMLSVAMTATMVTAFSMSASAETAVQENYYTFEGDTATLQTDTIDPSIYQLTTDEAYSETSITDEYGNVTSIEYMSFRVTEPCVAYGWFKCNNSDQTLISVSYDYDMLLSLDPSGSWKSGLRPQYGPANGDYEYAKLTVTKADLAAAGGTVTIHFGIRANLFPDHPINDLGQVYIGGIRIYTEKSKKTISSDTQGNSSGDSTLSMSGTAVPAPTYTVMIPTAIDFGTCEKKMANDAEANKIKTITLGVLTVNHSHLFANEKMVTVTLGSNFSIKNGESSLAFALYDGENQLADNTTLFKVNPTAADTNATESKTLTAQLDQSQIKKNNTTYTGTVTFTVALADAE